MAKNIDPRVANLNEKIARITDRRAAQMARLKVAKKAQNDARIERIQVKIDNSNASLKKAKASLAKRLKAAA